MAPKAGSSGPTDPAPDDEEDLRSRTDARRERKETEEALMRLGQSLVELPERTLEKLGLAEDVLDVVQRARLVRDGGPRNRALRLVRMALRDADAEAIARRLREVHEPPRRGAGGGAVAGDAITRWREALVAGGEDSLNEFVAEFPGSDRQKLRNLVRNVRRAKDASRPKALSALDGALREVSRARDPSEPGLGNPPG